MIGRLRAWWRTRRDDPAMQEEALDALVDRVEARVDQQASTFDQRIVDARQQRFDADRRQRRLQAQIDVIRRRVNEHPNPERGRS